MTDPYRPLKNAFGRFATGVAVATCAPEDKKVRALTINSFSSVSLEPPIVLWCIERKATSFPCFMAVDHYGVSVLPATGAVLSDRFARHDGPALTTDEYETWVTGAPILKNRIAGFDCRVVGRHEAGDHIILVGEVLRFDSDDRAPLVYFASRYHSEVEKP